MNDNIPQLILRILGKLKIDLPGKSHQKEMKVLNRKKLRMTFPSRRAASSVIIILFEQDAKWMFLLTKRSEDVEHHKGQVSLPGGMVEESESLEKAALREAKEEIGIDPQSLIVLGKLSELFIPVSGFEVTPFVGWAKTVPRLNLKNAEVTEVYNVPVEWLIDPHRVKSEMRTIRGVELEIPYYDFGDAKVWGATAMILSEFKEVLRRALGEDG